MISNQIECACKSSEGKNSMMRQQAPFDVPVVRHAYEASINAVARLTTYSLAERLSAAEDEVKERCRRLVIDDLVGCAISVRRLVEATNLVARCKNIDVSEAQIQNIERQERGLRKGSINLWTLNGVIVHSRMLNVIDERLHLALFMASRPSAIYYRFKEAPIRIEPLCFVASDRTKVCFFVADFATRVSQLLDAARTACENHGLYLEQDFLD